MLQLHHPTCSRTDGYFCCLKVRHTGSTLMPQPPTVLSCLPKELTDGMSVGSFPSSRLIRTNLFHGRIVNSTEYQTWPNVLRREEIVISLHVAKRVSSFHHASSDLRDMENANPSLTQERTLQPPPTSHATEAYRKDKAGQRATAAKERWRKNCFCNPSSFDSAPLFGQFDVV